MGEANEGSALQHSVPDAKDTGRNKCADCCGNRIAYLKRFRKDRFSYSAKCPNSVHMLANWRKRALKSGSGTFAAKFLHSAAMRMHASVCFRTLSDLDIALLRKGGSACISQSSAGQKTVPVMKLRWGRADYLARAIFPTSSTFTTSPISGCWTWPALSAVVKWSVASVRIELTVLLSSSPCVRLRRKRAICPL